MYSNKKYIINTVIIELFYLRFSSIVEGNRYVLLYKRRN